MKKSNGVQAGKTNSRWLSPDESFDVFVSIVRPHAEKLVELREKTNGIVFLAHNPGKLTKAVLRKLGVRLARDGSDTIFAMSCREALYSMGLQDDATRRWLATAPATDEVKLWYFGGDGTALVTLRSTGGEGVHVTFESNAQN